MFRLMFEQTKSAFAISIVIVRKTNKLDTEYWLIIQFANIQSKDFLQ